MSHSTDPRAARSREAMLAAARQLLADEGPGAVTHQRVAQRAGVGRATVYRPEAQLDRQLQGEARPPHGKRREGGPQGFVRARPGHRRRSGRWWLA